VVRWRDRLSLTIAVLGLVTAACGREGANRTAEGVFFPVHDESSGPAAILGGVLREEEGCLFGVPDGKPRLVIWPAGYSYEAGRLYDESGNEVAVEGEEFLTGGGEVPQGVVDQLLGSEAIPEPCQTSPYWMSTGVLPPGYPNGSESGA